MFVPLTPRNGLNFFFLQTDKTALFLIGAVAPPIVQSLVDQAALTFDQAILTYGLLRTNLTFSDRYPL